MAESLFRPEAASARQGDWLDAVRLQQPPPLRWLTGAAFALAVAVAAFLSIATYTRKASLPGLLLPPAGVVRLAAPMAATVAERRVVDGQAVRQGEVLFVLRPSHGALLGAAQAEVLRSLEDRRLALQDGARLQQQLTLTRSAALQRRWQAQQQELAQLDAELAAQQQRESLAQASLDRLRALQAQQFVAPAQVQLREEELLAVRTQTQSLRRQRATWERERAELDGERASLPLQGAQQQGELARLQAQLARERAEQDPVREVTVLAPHDGVVAAVGVQAGQSVVEGSPLASVMPASQMLEAQLLAPASAVGQLRPGQPVRIRYDAYPFQRWGLQGGQVVAVSPLPLSPGDLAALPLLPAGVVGGAGEPRFRVTVRLDAAPGPTALALRAGLSLQADVGLETRRWIEWMLAPALGVAQRL